MNRGIQQTLFPRYLGREKKKVQSFFSIRERERERMRIRKRKDLDAGNELGT